MGIEQKTHFIVNKSKCIQCGKYINVCSGMVIEFGRDGYPEMKSFERYGWRGCWRCEHCLAVCPAGAISIFDKKPENSLLPPPPEMGDYMERLVVNRRSCRRYLDKNVDSKIINRILSAMASAPTGGNSCGVEYTVIDDKDRVKQIWDIAYHPAGTLPGDMDPGSRVPGSHSKRGSCLRTGKDSQGVDPCGKYPGSYGKENVQGETA